MHPLFPKPLPDETVFSLLCRFHLLSAQGSFKANTLDMMGINASRPSNELPSFLPSFSKVSGISINQLIHNFTSVHYYEPFMSKGCFKTLVSGLANGETSSLQSKLGMVANRMMQGQNLKFCPQCAESDIEKYGITYWRVTHQLVGVNVCNEHHCQLYGVPRTSVKIILPPQCSSIDCNNVDCDLTQLIFDEFHDNSFSYCLNKLRNCYESQLSKLGFLTTGRRIRQRLLKAYLCDRLSQLSATSKAYQLLYSECSLGRYPECLFYLEHCNHQPLKHLFLIFSLFGSWQAFKASFNSSMLDIEHVERSSVTKPIEWAKGFDLLNEGKSLRQAAMAVGTTVSTLKIKALQKGICVDTRPSKIFEDTQRAIWRKLFIGIKCREIASMMKLSIGAVEKVLSRYPELVTLRKKIRDMHKRQQHRQNLQRAASKFQTRNEIKRALSGSYMWLYKHDRTWLYQHLPEAIPRSIRRKCCEMGLDK